MLIFLLQLLASLGSYASLVGVALSFKPLAPLQLWLTGLGAVLALITVAGQIAQYIRNKPISLHTDQQIRNYMFKWISRGGRVTIFSRDMSWVRDEEMKDLLRVKARSNELTLCLPTRIDLSDELLGAGAQVLTYPELDYTPQSRFTIINEGRMDAQVAVGRKVKDSHKIVEASVGEHPMFFIANDLLQIVTRFNSWKDQGPPGS